MRSRGPALVAAILALAAPGAALAQSAGDDQYRDPFAGEEQPPSQGGDSGGGNSGGSTGGGSTGGGGGTTTSGTVPVAPVSTTTEPVATTGATLPRTGLPALILTAVGLSLIAGGFGIRRSTD